MRSALARRAGVTGTDLDALEHLEADGPMTQRQLGDRLLLTSGAVTMLVDRLQREGWVVRRPHPSDRRAVLLELVEQMLRDLPPELEDYHKRIVELVAAIPPEHRHAVSSLLEAAADAASRAAGTLASGEST
jgi:DNA-binding MarR family transcriptional regulator